MSQAAGNAIPDFKKYQAKAIDAGIRSTAMAFHTEVMSECIEKEGPIDGDAAIKTVMAYSNDTQIKMTIPIGYDKKTGNCTGAFTVTDVKSGQKRNFHLPMTEADKQAAPDIQ